VAVLPYLDIVLVVLFAAPVLAAGAPVLGYMVGATAWITMRATSVAVERRLAGIDDIGRRLGFGVGYSMLRVWILACAIIIVGVMGARADGLTAALVIFGAFSVSFACSAIGHISRTRAATR